MPAPITAGLVNYLVPLLANAMGTSSYSVYDEETPRWDANGNAIAPSSTTGSWPMVGLSMEEPGFRRTHTIGHNSLHDDGVILVQIWATTKPEVQDMMDLIEGFFEAQVSVYTDVDMGGPPNDPNYVISMLLDTWWIGLDKNNRTSVSQLLYRGDMRWETKVHGNVATTT